MKYTRIFMSTMMMFALLCILTIVRFGVDNNFRWCYVGNAFLGILPMIFALLLNKSLQGGRRALPYIVISAIGWLFFLPNAFYIITDFIHLDVYDYGFQIKDELVYGRTFNQWFDFMIIFLAYSIGAISGYFSLNLVEEMVAKKKGVSIGKIFSSIVLFLCAFGIYLGRFIRLNSWDILNPFKILYSMIEYLNIEAILFALLLGIILNFIYFTTCMIGNPKISSN